MCTWKNLKRQLFVKPNVAFSLVFVVVYKKTQPLYIVDASPTKVVFQVSFLLCLLAALLKDFGGTIQVVSMGVIFQSGDECATALRLVPGFVELDSSNCMNSMDR